MTTRIYRGSCHCGAVRLPVHERAATPGRYRVNLGCVADLDPFALAIEIIDGRSC